MTKAQIETLIDENLADFSNIIPSKHREVEHAILDYATPISRPTNIGFVTGLNVGASSGSMTVGGDVASATATSSTNETFITVNLTNAMVNTNFKVNMTIESLGTLGLDNDINCPVFKIVSTTQIQISISETGSSAQNLKVHIETVQL